MVTRIGLGLVVCCLVCGLAAAVLAAPMEQVPLTPASVIGGNGSYSANPWDSSAAGGQFNGSNITNGNFTEPVGVGGSGFQEWLGRESTNNQYLVIDLGASYALSQINLYNTHNGQYNDSGTQNFQIDASNSVSFIDAAVDYDLSGPITTILSGVLSDTSGQASITPDQFSVNGGSYRYLRFTALDFRAGDVRVGLNELEAFFNVAPEPSSLLMLTLGAFGLARQARRRRGAKG
jgi:hypothetical protein